MKASFITLVLLLALSSSAQAGEILVTATVSGHGIDDPPRDGTFTIEPANPNLRSHLFRNPPTTGEIGEIRGVAEFSLALPAGAVIVSAMLRLTDIFDTLEDDEVQLRGYEGNGAIAPGDMTAGDGVVDWLLNTNISNTEDDTNSYNVTTFVKDLYDRGIPFAGFRIQDALESEFAYGVPNGPEQPADEVPLLTIVYEEAAAVPEPASLLTLGLGILGMSGYSWSRRRISVR